MSDDIRSILARLEALEEGKITPVGIKHGLNQQQQGVPQLPALFKPKKISALGSKTDPQHPMKGMAVGANESQESRSALEEAMQEVEEDMLSKVKRDLTHYLDKLEKKIKIDPKLTDKAVDAVERGQAEEDRVEEDPTAQDPAVSLPDVPTPDPVLPEAAPVKTYTMEDGTCFECWGNERDGFEIRHGTRSLPSRFRKLDDADTAIKMFQHRRKQQELDQDYIEER